MIKESGKFKWIDKGEGEKPIILLHGLMGGWITSEKWLILSQKNITFMD